MSVRCKLGWHRYQQVPVRRHTTRFAKSHTNAVCVRCGNEIWLNWPTEASA